jgi:hypothetical protein
VLTLAAGELDRLAGRDGALQQQRHGVLGGAADRAAPELGRRGETQLAEQQAPGITMVHARVQQHAVHVEDDGARRRSGHERRR